MTRTKLAQRTLPDYTKKEEIINSVSHIVGAVFGFWALLSCFAISVKSGNVYSAISSVVYGISMIFLYSMSSIYHGLRVGTAKKVFQIIDHCAIFVLIAGTYTPVLLCAVRLFNPTAAFVLLGCVWAVSALGIVLNSIDLKKYKVFSMICYLALGWLIIIELYPLYKNFGLTPVALLFAGGVCYTVGSVLYGAGKKKKYFHSVFHFFVLAGSVFQYICIAFYMI